jgi:sugar O-acyltransferase (sialic acid O-acetyltransferase NeuD family)
MKKAIIFGKGGHAKVIHSFIANRYEEISFITQEDENRIFQNPENYRANDFYIGIGDNSIRTKVFNKLKELKLQLPICIGPLSFVALDAKIGQGSFIGAGSVIMASAHVGENVIINTHSSVDHDCELGDHSQLTAGITLGGETKIGKNCFFGVKASSIPGITIGDNVQVMAGSLLTKNVESNMIVGGYPAKLIKTIE